MRPALIDTDILSMFFRNDRSVVACFERYLGEHTKANFSIITYYEIVSGLKHRDAQRRLGDFLEFTSFNAVLPLTERSCSISADIYR